MAKERNGAARVIAQEGGRLQVEHRGQRLTVLMQGFPPGFTLRPGARVILTDETSGTVARPLTRFVRSRMKPEDLAQRGLIEVPGARLELQPSTVLDEAPQREGARASEDYEVWIVEGTETDPTSQVIAARRL